MFFFHFSVTCYLNSNGSTKFLESTIAFDSFLEGPCSTPSRMLCLWKHKTKHFTRSLTCKAAACSGRRGWLTRSLGPCTKCYVQGSTRPDTLQGASLAKQLCARADEVDSNDTYLICRRNWCYTRLILCMDYHDKWIRDDVGKLLDASYMYDTNMIPATYSGGYAKSSRGHYVVSLWELCVPLIAISQFDNQYNATSSWGITVQQRCWYVLSSSMYTLWFFPYVFITLIKFRCRVLGVRFHGEFEDGKRR